jgi:hypothetical protein
MTLARRWHRDVNRAYKRLWLSFRSSHTLMAGLFFRGATGALLPRLTRAQTVQILLNTLVLELVILCMLLSSPGDDPRLVINPIKIIAAGCLAALICIPGAFLSAALFAPRQLLGLLGRLIVFCAFCPFRSLRCCCRCLYDSGQATTRACGIIMCCVSMRTSDAGPDAEWRGRHGWRRSAAAIRPNRSVVSDEDIDDAGRWVAVHVSERQFSYVSLDEYMSRSSLRISLRKGEWRAVIPLSIGWTLNWLIMLGLMAVFSAYGCEFYASLAGVEASGTRDALLLAWAWSVFQRFLINEPALILAQKGIPMCFASAMCEHLCSESCVAVLGLIIEGIATISRSLRTMGAA